MLSIPPTVRIYLATAPTDMRKSHDGLAAIVEHGIKADPLSGDLFVFRNKRAESIFPPSRKGSPRSRSRRRSGRCCWGESSSPASAVINASNYPKIGPIPPHPLELSPHSSHLRMHEHGSRPTSAGRCPITACHVLVTPAKAASVRESSS